MQELITKHGRFAETCRWFEAYDSAAFLLKIRHARGLLVDVAVMCQNASPYKHSVDFADNLSVIFIKEQGHSLQVASHILRDNAMWKVLQIRHDICAKFRISHGKRIKQDRGKKKEPSSLLSLRMRKSWAAGEWMEVSNEVMKLFSAGEKVFLKWGLLEPCGQDGRNLGGAGQDNHDSNAGQGILSPGGQDGRCEARIDGEDGVTAEGQVDNNADNESHPEQEGFMQVDFTCKISPSISRSNG